MGKAKAPPQELVTPAREGLNYQIDTTKEFISGPSIGAGEVKSFEKAHFMDLYETYIDNSNIVKAVVGLVQDATTGEFAPGCYPLAVLISETADRLDLMENLVEAMRERSRKGGLS